MWGEVEVDELVMTLARRKSRVPKQSSLSGLPPAPTAPLPLNSGLRCLSTLNHPTHPTSHFLTSLTPTLLTPPHLTSPHLTPPPSLESTAAAERLADYSRDSPLLGSPETDSGSESLKLGVAPQLAMPEASGQDSHLSSLTAGFRDKLGLSSQSSPGLPALLARSQAILPLSSSSSPVSSEETPPPHPSCPLPPPPLFLHFLIPRLGLWAPTVPRC